MKARYTALLVSLASVWTTWQVSRYVPSIVLDVADNMSARPKQAQSGNSDSLPRANSSPSTQTFSLETYYQNPTILSEGCSITVLLMDPNIDTAATWALESLAINIHPIDRVCVLLQTSICTVEMPPGIKEHNSTLAYILKAQRIEQQAPPHFRAMIRNGQVRMTVLHHERYFLSCSNFYSPSNAWTNYRYWGPEEFDERLDSDRVLTIQDDVVFCQPLNLSQWENVAWVGAPWPAREGNKFWHFCTVLPRMWKEYHERQNVSVPEFPTPKRLCSDVSIGPQGNGGVSIRSRQWLRRAIQYCPSTGHLHSGLSPEQQAVATCSAGEDAIEDVYFVTILRGLGAPLPSAFDAALFSWESRSIAITMKDYQIRNTTWRDEKIRQRWSSVRSTSSRTEEESNDAVKRFEAYDPSRVVPIAVHKPWSEMFKDHVCDATILQQCPLLRRVVENNNKGQALMHTYEAENGRPCFPEIVGSEEPVAEATTPSHGNA